MRDQRLNNIVKILVKELNPLKLILFGSQGKGIESFNSDYDIAIDSDTIDFTQKRELKKKIDEVMGLHKIDLVYLKEIYLEFRNIIPKTGKVIYEG